MGANHSYDKAIGGVPANARTHTDTGYRVANHKVVLQTKNNSQAVNIMNSNSKSPIYLIGRRRNDGSIEIHSVNVFEGHKLSMEINLKYTSSGRLKSYSGKEADTHCHYWEQHSDGNMHRKSTQHAHEPVPAKYAALLKHIVKFNSENKK